MKRFVFIILVSLWALVSSAQTAPATIGYAERVTNGIKDLSSCFGSDNKPLFDQLYIIGRTWYDKSINNYSTAISTADAGYQTALLNGTLSDQLDGCEIRNNDGGTTGENCHWVVGVKKKWKYIEVVHTCNKTSTYSKGTKTSGWTEGTESCDITEEIPHEVDENELLPESTKPAWNNSGRPKSANNGDTWSYPTIVYSTYYWVDRDGNEVSSGTVVREISGSIRGILVKVIKNHVEYNLSENGSLGECRPYDWAYEWQGSDKDNAVRVERPGDVGADSDRRGQWYHDDVAASPFADESVEYTFFPYEVTATTAENYTSAVNAIATTNTNNTTKALRQVCYVYDRNSDGTQYIFNKIFDPRKEPIGTFSIGGKHIYITGICIPYSCMNNNDGGSNYALNSSLEASVADGPGFIVIDNNGTNNIYLEDCQLTTTTPANYSTIHEGNGMSQKVRTGISSPIVLQKSGNTTNIHIKGKNYLMGHSGLILDIVMDYTAALHGAAVYINTNSSDQIVCTFDDKWPQSYGSSSFSRTNGYLKMAGEKGEKQRQTCPIYCGNSKSTVNFDGGQYRFITGDEAGTNTHKMVVARYTYSKTVAILTFTAYNVGGDEGDMTVNIKGGTFSMAPAFNNITPMTAGNGERNDGLTIMYFPQKTYITGGTFNDCLVRTLADANAAPACPKNRASGETVFDVYVEVDESSDLNSDGTVRKPSSIPDVTSEQLDAYNWTGMFDWTDNTSNHWITPYLPAANRECVQASFYQNWDLGFCSNLSEYAGAHDRRLYQNTKTNLTYSGTRYLGLFEINPYYPQSKNSANSHITETADYEISNGVYLFTWIMSDKWRIITPPFDVSDVYLIETWATNAKGNYCSKAAGDNYNADKDDEFQYLIYMAQQMVVRGNLSDLESNLGSSKNLKEIYSSCVSGSMPTEEYMSGDDNNHWNRGKALSKLKYWKEDGTTTAAHYYLYEATGNNGDATAVGLGSQFSNIWTIQPRRTKDGNQIIMEAGKTYAIMFPNWAQPGEDGYNFWDGKYLILEGPGQTIKGTDSFQQIVTPTTNNQFKFAGNPTFGYIRPSQDYIFTWDYQNQEFVRGASKNLSWLDSYFVCTDASIQKIASIGRTGTAEYRDLDEDENFKLGASDVGFDAFAVNDAANITSYESQVVNIYNMEGKLVYSEEFASDENKSVPLSSGIYLVSGTATSKSQKLVVR